MDLQHFIISISFITVLVIATSTMALADQSLLIESFTTEKEKEQDNYPTDGK